MCIKYIESIQVLDKEDKLLFKIACKKECTDLKAYRQAIKRLARLRYKIEDVTVYFKYKEQNNVKGN